MAGLTATHRVSTGNQGDSCPSSSRGSCPPLNPMECGISGCPPATDSRIVCLSCPNIFAILVSQWVSQFFLDEYTGCVGFLRDLLMPPVGFFALINKGERRVDFIFDVFNFLSGTND